MGKNKYLQALSKKKDFALLKKKGRAFSYKCLKFLYIYQEESEGLKVAWGLSKKTIPNSVVRNRLKRWGRENLKKSSLKGFLLILFFDRGKNFYAEFKRRDFDHIFEIILEKRQRKN